MIGARADARADVTLQINAIRILCKARRISDRLDSQRERDGNIDLPFSIYFCFLQGNSIDTPKGAVGVFFSF